ncbi:MAG: hypothetical protein ABIS06_01540 [Vicinamibacterales bacterium]
MRRIVGSGLIGAFAGFLTRPCCIGPVLLSLVGVSSAGLANIVAASRPLFLLASAILVLASLWMTFRREGGSAARIAATAATLAAFLVAIRLAGVL